MPSRLQRWNIWEFPPKWPPTKKKKRQNRSRRSSSWRAWVGRTLASWPSSIYPTVGFPVFPHVSQRFSQIFPFSSCLRTSLKSCPRSLVLVPTCRYDEYAKCSTMQNIEKRAHIIDSLPFYLFGFILDGLVQRQWHEIDPSRLTPTTASLVDFDGKWAHNPSRYHWSM